MQPPSKYLGFEKFIASISRVNDKPVRGILQINNSFCKHIFHKIKTIRPTKPTQKPKRKNLEAFHKMQETKNMNDVEKTEPNQKTETKK